jgi:hypothetical protein
MYMKQYKATSNSTVSLPGQVHGSLLYVDLVTFSSTQSSKIKGIKKFHVNFLRICCANKSAYIANRQSGQMIKIDN